jgi:hypothetical protein
VSAHQKIDKSLKKMIIFSLDIKNSLEFVTFKMPTKSKKTRGFSMRETCDAKGKYIPKPP